MKKYFTLLFISFSFLLTINGQTILVVDDSGDNFDNTGNLTNALDVLGRSYDIYDAYSEGASPNANAMSDYDIVIWHPSTSNQNLQFWGGNGTTNSEISEYLDQGGILWVSGNDYLFEKYEVGKEFSSGDFEYDYLGLKSYDFQTYNDDGNIGMAKAIPTAETPISNLNDLDFIFETLWYNDGVTGIEGTTPIYEMNGGSDYPDYVKNGATTALLNQTSDFTVLSYYFDIGLASDQSLIENNVDAVLNYFSSLISNTSDYTLKSSLAIMPNPAQDFIILQSDITGEFSISIYNAMGALVMDTNCYKGQQIDISNFETGVYFLQAETKEGIIVKKLIKQ